MNVADIYEFTLDQEIEINEIKGIIVFIGMDEIILKTNKNILEIIKICTIKTIRSLSCNEHKEWIGFKLKIEF